VERWRASPAVPNNRAGPQRRLALKQICSIGNIFDAWSDEEWTVEGAAVRVSIVCFAGKSYAYQPRLNGKNVKIVFSDLPRVPLI
jgi:hypothetical protein